MNWKLGLAPLAIGATLAATLLAQAAPGDALVKANDAEVILSAEQKPLAGAALLAVYPGANASTVQSFNCDKSACDGTYTTTGTRTQYFADKAAGVAARKTSKDGGVYTYLKQAKRKALPAGAVSAVEAFSDSFCSRDYALAIDFRCRRDGDDIKCQCAWTDTVTEAEADAIEDAERLIDTIDIVE